MHTILNGCHIIHSLLPSADVLHVLNRDARAKKFAFQILATGCKYHLATETPEDREKWVQGLKRLLFGPPRPGVVCEPHTCIMYPLYTGTYINAQVCTSIHGITGLQFLVLG